MSQALDKLLQSYSDANDTDTFTSCIDAQYGINRKDANPLDIQKYTQVIQYLVSAGFKTQHDQGVDKLTIVPVKSYTSDNHITYSSIHVLLQEQHIIREYCESAIEEKIIEKYMKTPFIRVWRRNYIPVEAYMADNNMTVTYHKEQTFTRPDENAEVLSLLSNWGNTKKRFKLTNCVTYTHPDHIFSVDLCLSRESRFGQNNTGKFVAIPTLTLSEANLSKNMERVEIYLRFPSNGAPIPAKVIREELRFGSRLILGGIQDTMYPISFSEMNKVLTQYMHLFRPGEVLDEKRFGGIDKRRIPFIGPYTESISPQNVSPIPNGPTTNIPNIRAGMAVTDKTDGSRALLFIAPSRKLYMITPSMDVIYTGAQIRDVAFVNTLFDGEFVAFDRHKKPLHLFAVFDVYFVQGENVRGRSFLRPGYVIPEEDMVKDEYPFTPRYHLLAHLIQMRLQLVYSYGDCPIPFTLKAKSFYYPTANPEMSIFQQCAAILNDTSYEYERDGLIFTDMDMPVGVNVRTAPEDLFRHKARWAYSLKWKPSDQNSIDFLVRYKWAENDKPTIVSEVDATTGQFARYYVVHLFCTGTAKDNPMNAFLFPTNGTGTNREPAPVLFRPTDPISETAYEARILMDYVNNDWVIRTNEMELLEDDSIVEFYYDMNSPPQYRWKPMRMRYDKTYDYKVNKKRVYGNSFQTANQIWSSIHNPITSDMISTGLHLPAKTQDLTNIYYNRDGSKIFTKGLRQFHNYYVKQKLLKAVLHSDTTLIDYSCGRGGDVNKWVDLRVKFVLGIDLSRDNIHNAWAGVYARLLTKMQQGEQVFPGFFLPGNSVDPIRTGEIATNEYDKTRLLQLFGSEPPLPVEEVGPILSSSYGIAKNGFHVGSCQFSIHYFFKDPTTLHAFLRNVSETIAMGGHFVGTCYDGDTVFHKLKSKNAIRLAMEGQTIFRAEKLYTATTFEKDASSLGYPISVYQDSINQTIVEYLVQFQYLCNCMKRYGFTLLTAQETADKGMVGNGMFMELFSDLYKRRFDPLYEQTFESAIQMSVEEKEISSWNRWFIFKKTHATKESEWDAQLKLDLEVFSQSEAGRGVLHEKVNAPQVPLGEEDIVLDYPEESDEWDKEEAPMVSPEELFQVVEVAHRTYQAGEPVTLFHAKARRPLSSLSTYMEINGPTGVLIPSEEGVFRNPQGKMFISAEHAYRSQFFTNDQTRARFSTDGDIGDVVKGFDLIGLKDKPKEEWMKRRGVGILAKTVMNTKASQKKFGVIPDTEPVDPDKTWLHILKYVYTDPSLKQILLDTGTTYLLEKDENESSVMGGHVDGTELKGQNKMGHYVMTIRDDLVRVPAPPTARLKPVRIPTAKNVLSPITPSPIPANAQLPTKANDLVPVNAAFLRETFPDADGVDRTQLLMTNQGRYSVSKTNASQYLIDLIRLRLPSTNPIRVTDATGSVGSDSIALGMHYSVNSIELNPTQFKVLSHNIHTYGSHVNIQLYNGDSLQLIPQLTQDVVYIDAPWGGRGYKDQRTLLLYVSGQELSEIYNAHSNHCKCMIFKVPPNYNIPHFRAECHAKHIEDIPFYKPDDPSRVSFVYLVCSDMDDPPTDLPVLAPPAQDESHRPFFTEVDPAVEFFRPYLPTTVRSAESATFAMTEDALKNTLNYFMNVLFQTGFLLVVTDNPDDLPVMYNIRTRTTRLEERVYVPFIKHHMDVLKNNGKRKVDNKEYNRIVRKLKSPYRLLGSILKDLKININQDSKDINEYETFILKYKVPIPPGVYFLNLSDTVVLHPTREYPVPHIATSPMPPDGYYQLPMLPVFGASGRKLPDGTAYRDILIPTYDDIIDILTPPRPADIAYITDWNEKVDDRAIFRGSGTGEGCSVTNNMRFKVASWGAMDEWKSYLDAHLTSSSGKLRIDESGICQTTIPAEWVGPSTNMVEQSKYKYILHIDGNVAAYRLLKTLQTGSLVLRVKSPFTQWSDQYLVAGRHYMEVAADLSDLKQVIEYCRAHDAECAQIALDGKNVADRLRTAETIRDHMANAFQTVPE